MSKFLIRYPYSLITELLQIYNGKYIVRALFRVDEVTLASGLGSAETVEEAEDEARKRALAMVDLQEISNSRAITHAPTKSLTHTFINSNYSTDFHQPSFLSDLSVSGNGDFPPEPNPQESPINSSPTDEDQDESDQLVADIIAQIDLEINRLGWTKEQGRDCLLKNYGKKSRLLLSDQELREFLQYLQTQPTP